MIAAGRAQAEVTDYFENDAAFWDDVYARQDVYGVIYRERAERAVNEVRRLPLMIGSHALEVGCGTGLMAVRLALRGFVVEAIDPAPAMIERTRINAERSNAAERVTTRLGDVHRLDYPDESFSLVVALGVLPWLHAPEVALREMHRVMHRGGYLVATADNRARLTHFLDPLLNPFLQPLRRTLGHGPAGSAHAATMWPRRLDRNLRKAGFTKTRGLTVGFAPFTFLGRGGSSGRRAIAINNKLQQLADEQLPLLRSAGCHYIVVARKR